MITYVLNMLGLGLLIYMWYWLHDIRTTMDLGYEKNMEIHAQTYGIHERPGFFSPFGFSFYFEIIVCFACLAFGSALLSISAVHNYRWTIWLRGAGILTPMLIYYALALSSRWRKRRERLQVLKLLLEVRRPVTAAAPPEKREPSALEKEFLKRWGSTYSNYQRLARVILLVATIVSFTLCAIEVKVLVSR